MGSTLASRATTDLPRVSWPVTTQRTFIACPPFQIALPKDIHPLSYFSQRAGRIFEGFDVRLHRRSDTGDDTHGWNDYNAPRRAKLAASTDSEQSGAPRDCAT